VANSVVVWLYCRNREADYDQDFFYRLVVAGSFSDFWGLHRRLSWCKV
jgi:hypothetical protein